MESAQTIVPTLGAEHGAEDGGAARADELRSLYRLTDRLYRARSLDEAFRAGLEAITETLGCERASILLFDEEGVMRFRAWIGLSHAYRAALEGHTPWQPGELDPSPVFVADIAETEEQDWVKARVLEEGIRSLGFIPLTIDGGVVGKFMTYYAQRRKVSPHEVELAVTIARQVGFAVERHRSDALRRQAEQELRLSEESFRLMAEGAPVMIWISDELGRCVHLNRALREAWGVDAADVAAFDWQSTMHPEDVDCITATVAEAMVEKRAFTVDGRFLTADGSYRIFRTTARPNLSATGQLLGMIGVNVDITKDEEAAAQRELVFAELNHRVKNTLAVVQAIAQQTLKGAEAAPFAAAFQGRLANLAVAHGLLTRANWENVPLRQLVADALMLRTQAEGRFVVKGPEVSLPPKQALALAMALHELNTNASKYGSLSVDTGRVELDWSVTKATPAELHLSWRELGGPAAQEPETRGFGLFMIERILAQDTDGAVALEFRPQGLSCRIEAPLEAA